MDLVVRRGALLDALVPRDLGDATSPVLHFPRAGRLEFRGDVLLDRSAAADEIVLGTLPDGRLLTARLVPLGAWDGRGETRRAR